MQKAILLIIIITSLMNCNKPKGKLELEILTDVVYTYCLNTSCNPDIKNNLVQDDYDKNGYSLIKFKISNTSKNPVLFFPACEEFEDFGCSLIKSYPDNFRHIGISNLVIVDEKENIIEPDYRLINQMVRNENVCDFIKDSLNIRYYDKIGYKQRSYGWKKRNVEFVNKSFVIHSGETLFFESYLRIPTNLDSFVHDDFYRLNKDDSYKLKLKFKSNIENINNWLTDSQIKNIEHNNYKVFKGTLDSKNEIPIVFKELIK